VLAAFLATVFWAASAVCGARSTRLIGATEANFWRLLLSVVSLAIWAFWGGHGLFGPGVGLFVLSGFVGVGLGDTAFFQSLPRLGPRLTVLLVSCSTPPMGALIEWGWLGTQLSLGQIVCGLVILAGVATALLPARHLEFKPGVLRSGIAFTGIAALSGAVGAVLSRKAYAVAQAAGESLDGGTAAFERLLGGFVVAAFCLLLVRRREIRAGLTGNGADASVSAAKWRRAWFWVAANGFLGQTLGVSCYQWALGELPTGVVLSITALTPLTVIPLARMVDGEPTTLHSLVGSGIAVAGVVGLALQK
jgi:drug/metabolite transporter (DMT)-like permease